MYGLTKSALSEVKYVTGLSDLLTSSEIQIYHQLGEKFDRISSDGVTTFIGLIGDQEVGVIATDFRINGGSFAKENSARASSFIKYLNQTSRPLVFIINSLGVRFMEGRTVFDNAFSMIADLYEFRKNNLLITIGLHKALGISALFFAQGHYRLALENETLLNLTGPEVHKKFFGNVDADFNEYNLADHQFDMNSLIHGLQPTVQGLFRSAQNLISFVFSAHNSVASLDDAKGSSETEQGGLLIRSQEHEKLKELEEQLGEARLEIFTQRSPIARVYLTKIHGRILGVMLNPPGHPNNMLTVKTVDKCLSAMELFRVLKIPIVTLLDCPGGDPRKAESDRDSLMKMIQLTHEMISYPYSKMGIIVGRCFGGSGMFAFPKIYGGLQTVAVEGSQFGVMHKSIIEDLLSGSNRLKETWKQVSESEVSDLSDLKKSGTVDRVIARDQIKAELMKFVSLSDLIAEARINQTEKVKAESESEEQLELGSILQMKHNDSEVTKKVGQYGS